MKSLIRLVAVLTISIFILSACGGGGGGQGGGGGTQQNVKEEIRLAVLAMNSLMVGVINGLDKVIDDAFNNLNCNFNTNFSVPVIINGANHNLSASGKAILYSNNAQVDCNYLFESDYIFINRAEVSGSGNINGSELNSSFQGQFGIHGNAGYLVSGDIFNYIDIADYFIINGSGKIINTVYAGQKLPDVMGNASNIRVSVLDAFNLLHRANITLGDAARTVKSGDIYAHSSSCNSINMRFNGTNLIDVYSPCASPNHFRVNVDTGKIIE